MVNYRLLVSILLQFAYLASKILLFVCEKRKGRLKRWVDLWVVIYGISIFVYSNHEMLHFHVHDKYLMSPMISKLH